jgi:hypothetical protein
LLTEVKETARLTHLSVQDVSRRSVKIAKPVLRQSARIEKPERLSVWDALASGRGHKLKVAPMRGKVRKIQL